MLVRWALTMPLGVMAIALFYADVVADLQVAYQLYTSNNPIWAAESIGFLTSQYVVVYVCVPG